MNSSTASETSRNSTYRRRSSSAISTVTSQQQPSAMLKATMRNGRYRLRLERDGDRVRLITRGGYDWTKRYPWIVESAK
jgi:hypothetical protein